MCAGDFVFFCMRVWFDFVCGDLSWFGIIVVVWLALILLDTFDC